MLIYHQGGHNFVWNIQSIQEDGVGEGLIISPVNVEADRVADRIPAAILESSWMDPQFYLPADAKNKLATYPFFPGNIVEDFNSTDFEGHAFEVATQCLRFQHELGLRYLVIPVRYFEDLPDNYLEQHTALFVQPFLDAKRDLGLTEPLLLTVIAKPLQLDAGPARDELLSWATSFDDVDGVYLVLDNNFQSKQIKDAAFLAGALRFIRALRMNEMEVHVGYTGIEGLLYSVADPTSVSVGSYENLRSFSTLRLETRERGARRGPRPRIYSGRLLQWVEDIYLAPMGQLVTDWEDLFDDSPYKAFLLDPASHLSFQRSEIYKHYFYVFARQVADLPVLADRPESIQTQVKSAIQLFESIGSANVFLDSDSDGSHLPSWLNALAMFQAQPD